MTSKVAKVLLIGSLLVKYSTAVDCAPGTYFNSGASTCDPCPVNKFCLGGTDGAAVQANCAPGSQRATTGAVSQAECSNCLSGQTSTAGASCASCNAGQWVAGGSAPCADCPINTFCAQSGNGPAQQTTKANCPAGSQRTAVAATQASQCTTCTPGEYRTETGASCAGANCPINNYCPAGTGKTVLTGCPVGTEKPTAGAATSSSSCTDCAAGTYGDAVGEGCKDCPVGSYCPGKDVKTACPAGTTSEAKAKASTDCKSSSSANTLAYSTTLIGAAALGYLAL